MESRLYNRPQKKSDVVIFLKPKLLKILERTSLFLKVYKSGKIPKIIKLLPSLKNFEEILWLTRPDIWSDQAIFSITRSILPKLDKVQMSRFFSLVLTPRFQETIFNSSQYSIHIQKTIKISIRFSTVFLSSVFLPLCESKSCSVKEGAVLATIISKYHFNPSLLFSVLLRMLKPPITSIKCMIMRAILCKNYVVPHRILDSLVDFFVLNRNKIFSSQFKTFFIVFFRNYAIYLSNEDKKKVININCLK